MESWYHIITFNTKFIELGTVFLMMFMFFFRNFSHHFCCVNMSAIAVRRKGMKVLMAVKESWCHKLLFKGSFVEIGWIFPEIIKMCQISSSVML